MSFKKNLKWVLRPPVTSDTLYIAYGKDKNWKFEFYFCSGHGVLQLIWKEHLRHLMENLKGFMYPTAAKCEEITIFDQKQPFET